MDGGAEKTGSDQKVGVLRRHSRPDIWPASSLTTIRNGLRLLADILCCPPGTKEIFQLQPQIRKLEELQGRMSNEARTPWNRTYLGTGGTLR